LNILIISDAWAPQINGVVRTLEATVRELSLMGHKVHVVGPDPDQLFTFAMPFYPEIKVEFFARRRMSRIFRSLAPDFIHIATEGPLGWAARGLCLHEGRPFTTSYHTRFPEYLAARVPSLLSRPITYMAYAVLRRFHAPAGAVMIATASMERELSAHKFRHLVRWSRGVDTQLFHTYEKPFSCYQTLPRPILLYVGRVAVEKNLRAFLELKTQGSLIIIGDGPDLNALKKQYPGAHFKGSLKGTELAEHYAAADLFVFPSTTDTFGLVLLEACASGLRIAAYPAPGPKDIFESKETKAFVALESDLSIAVTRALALPDTREAPRAFAMGFSWQSCALQFYTHLQAPSPKARRKLLRWRQRIGEGM